jgi:Zn-dependent protease
MEPQQLDPPVDAPREYQPIQPRGTDWRGLAKKLVTPFVVLFGILLKVGSLAKFGTVFIAFGGYALLWSWKFALGFVLLIFIHEMGHWIEAKREGQNPQWPVFVPFLGAYVKHTGGNPWQTARVAIAGPIVGGLGALAFWVVGEANGSDLLVALAYVGFLLNLLNLLPFSILDGGHVWRATRWMYYGGGRERAYISGFLYVATAVLLAIGAYKAYLPQNRL